MSTFKLKALIYRNHLLPSSETFILNQTSHLRLYDYHYVGFRRVDGLELPADKVTTLHDFDIFSKMNEFSYKVSGVSPRFVRELRLLNPALIHAHFGPDAVRALPIARQLNIPLVATFHGYGASVSPSVAWRSSMNQFIYLLRRSKLKENITHCIAVSNFIKSLLLQQGFPEHKVSTHYIGVDTQKFTPDVSQSREQVVLFVGRLVDVKGCSYLIRSMVEAQKIIPEVKLIVIGDGSLRKELEELAEKRLKNYKFLGLQPPEVVRNWMNKSRVFCVPSIRAQSGHTEAFGIVFAEAQSMGLPVVSFDTGGISEAVEHGETGFLAEEKNVYTLTKYIIQLLENTGLWQKFSEQGMFRARSLFDIRKQTQSLEHLYSQVLHQSSKLSN